MGCTVRVAALQALSLAVIIASSTGIVVAGQPGPWLVLIEVYSAAPGFTGLDAVEAWEGYLVLAGHTASTASDVFLAAIDVSGGLPSSFIVVDSGGDDELEAFYSSGDSVYLAIDVGAGFLVARASAGGPLEWSTLISKDLVSPRVSLTEAGGLVYLAGPHPYYDDTVIVVLLDASDGSLVGGLALTLEVEDAGSVDVESVRDIMVAGGSLYIAGTVSEPVYGVFLAGAGHEGSGLLIPAPESLVLTDMADEGLYIALANEAGAVIAKISLRGEIVWEAFLGFPGAEWAFGQGLEAAGDRLYLGGTISVGGLPDIFVVSLDSGEASVIWARRLGSEVGAEYFYGMEPLAGDSILVAGVAYRLYSLPGGEVIVSLLEPWVDGYEWEGLDAEPLYVRPLEVSTSTAPPAVRVVGLEASSYWVEAGDLEEWVAEGASPSIDSYTPPYYLALPTAGVASPGDGGATVTVTTTITVAAGEAVGVTVTETRTVTTTITEILTVEVTEYLTEYRDGGPSMEAVVIAVLLVIVGVVAARLRGA